VGPHITVALDFMDGSRNGQSFWLEDGGFPRDALRLLSQWMRTHNDRDAWSALAGESAKRLLERVTHYWFDQLVDNMMPWTVQGVDKSDGSLSFRQRKFESSLEIRVFLPATRGDRSDYKVVM
jgi:cholesterol oxidase